MVGNVIHKLGLGLSTLAVWGMAAASVGYWGLKLSASPQAATAAPVGQDNAAVIDSTAVSKFLGGARVESTVAVAAPVASRYVLTGVAAASASGERGVALIAIDGKPAKPYRVGASLEDGVLLKSVQARQVSLAAAMDGAALAVLELPVKK